MQTTQKLEAERLLHWIRGHRADWDNICGRGDRDDLSDEEMFRLLVEMKEQSFYQIALVLLTWCDIRPKSSRAVFTSLVDTVLEQENGVDRFLQRVIENF